MNFKFYSEVTVSHCYNMHSSYNDNYNNNFTEVADTKQSNTV